MSLEDVITWFVRGAGSSEDTQADLQGPPDHRGGELGESSSGALQEEAVTSNSHITDDIDDDAEDDLVNQRVKRPIRLKGEDADTARRREHVAALGGMRNPRLSVQRVPKHRAVGKKAFKLISSELLMKPDIEASIFSANWRFDQAT